MVLVSPPSAPKNRAWDSHQALDFASSIGVKAVVEPDFARAIKEAASTRGRVIITGSFHTVGDALVELGEKTL